jgi:Flp pilus assembly pilin Flp
MFDRVTLIVGRALTLRPSDLKREEGQGITEYGMALAFVAVALVAVLGILKGYITDFIDKVGDDINALPGNL